MQITANSILNSCSRRWNDWPEFPYGRYEYFLGILNDLDQDGNALGDALLSYGTGKDHTPQKYAGMVRNFAKEHGIKLTIKEIVAAFKWEPEEEPL